MDMGVLYTNNVFSTLLEKTNKKGEEMSKVLEFYEKIERKWKKMERRAFSDFVKDQIKKKKKGMEL